MHSLVRRSSCRIGKVLDAQVGIILSQGPHQRYALKNARCMGRLEGNKELDYGIYPF
jgi:hypothetical protein